MSRLNVKIFLFWLLMLPFAASPSLAEVADQESKVTLGDGQRISLRDGEISILSAKNWEIFTEIPGLTLLMRAPQDPETRYQRTIQIASFNGPRYMDEITAKEFESLIVRKFAATSASIKKYRIRNYTNVELDDRRPGLLFYSEFSVDGVNLMQAHILVSSIRRHFLITFTDVAYHFEGSTQGPFLEEAWTTMRSAQLRGEIPRRFRVTLTMVYVAGGIIVLLGGLAILRIGYSGHSLKKDVVLAYDEKTAHLAHDPEAGSWTLPEARNLKKRGDADDDDDLMVEDEVS